MIQEDTQHGLLASHVCGRKAEKQRGRETGRQTDRQILKTLKEQNLYGGPRAE